jgi:glutamate-1-semialdehyde 2,1-aminomutase
MPKADSPPTSPMAIPDGGLQVKGQYKHSGDLTATVIAAKKRFIERNPNSRRLFDAACGSLPGGNTRTLLYSAPFPICMKKGEAYQVIDEDDHL